MCIPKKNSLECDGHATYKIVVSYFASRLLTLLSPRGNPPSCPACPSLNDSEGDAMIKQKPTEFVSKSTAAMDEWP